jgi:1-deoxy-D-xylulose-5-phosphate reductoisomerase
VGNPLTRLAVLGSTGSIGRQTLEVVRAHPDRLHVTALAAGQNAALLAEQVREFRPSMVFCERPEELRPLLGENLPACVSLEEMASDGEVDLVMSAIVGKTGLQPAFAALKAGKALALANKEAMVMAGRLLARTAEQHGGEIRPVDSEHSAIWQCLAGEDAGNVKLLVITASGGALRDLPVEKLAEVTPEEALAHPTWTMGRRITIDSATLFNKGLEVIEAHLLFGIPYDRIDVLMHRESIVHSMVEMVDGSLKAQLSAPDMRQPILYALTYPDRLPLELPRVDFARLGALHFGELDRERYPCIVHALEAGRRGGTYPAAIAAADEEGVFAFLDGRLRFLDIPRLLADTLEAHNSGSADSLDEILQADAWGRDFARGWIKDHRWT